MDARYSDTIMDHFLEPRNRGRLAEPTGTGISGVPGAGPYMVFQIRIDDGFVAEVRFQSHNCGVTVACGSMLTEMMMQRPLTECLAITCNDLIRQLHGIPEDKRHVPQFVLAAMQMAVEEAAHE